MTLTNEEIKEERTAPFKYFLQKFLYPFFNKRKNQGKKAASRKTEKEKISILIRSIIYFFM
jgi:hypothetical protein